MNPHSHLNPVPGDTYYWTPMTPQTPQPANSPISLHDVSPTTTWKKVLCQPNIQADSTGRLLRRILSITNTEPPVPLHERPAPPASTRPQLPELTQPLPTAYNIFVDGGWTTTQADFHTAFQEQRDPTNRQGSAGIAIVPTGPDWMQQGTILLTLNEGSQSGSQPAHMELAAIIIGLAIRLWTLPPQQGDIIYSDCKSLTDVLKSSAPPAIKTPSQATIPTSSPSPPSSPPPPRRHP